jgi:DNA-binding transcriptional MerR regulator
MSQAMTIDGLAARAGTTTRHVRSLQTMGLLPRPALRVRTGLYDSSHLHRLVIVLRLQDQGFSLRSLSILFAAHDRGESLASVLGLEPTQHRPASTDGSGAGGPGGPGGAFDTDDSRGDSAELYGFAALEARQDGGRQSLLWVVPTTMWDEVPASGVA